MVSDTIVRAAIGVSGAVIGSLLTGAFNWLSTKQRLDLNEKIYAYANRPKPNDVGESITFRRKLNAGASYEAVGHRVGATKDVLKKHYDHPQKDEESERYRDEMMKSNKDGSGYAN